MSNESSSFVTKAKEALSLAEQKTENHLQTLRDQATEETNQHSGNSTDALSIWQDWSTKPTLWHHAQNLSPAEARAASNLLCKGLNEALSKASGTEQEDVNMANDPPDFDELKRTSHQRTGIPNKQATHVPLPTGTHKTAR